MIASTVYRAQRVEQGEAGVRQRGRVARAARAAPPAAGRGRGARGEPPAPGPGGAGASRSGVTSRARSASSPSAREVVFEGDTLADVQARREEPREGADRRLHDRRQRARPRRYLEAAAHAVDPARASHAAPLGSDCRSSRARPATELPAAPDAPRARRLPARAPPRRSRSVSGSFARRSSSSWAPASTSSRAPAGKRTGTSASPCATTRTRPPPTADSLTSSRSV